MTRLLPLLTEFFMKSGLRKLSYAFYAQGLFVFLTYDAKISENAFVDLSTWLLAGVFAANSFEHFVKIKSKNGELNGIKITTSSTQDTNTGSPSVT